MTRDRGGEGEVSSGQSSSLAGRIGRRLRARRQELGRTLAETAARSGLSVSYLSAIEKGVNLPSLQTLVKISEALETTIPTVLVAEGANRVQVGRLPAEPSAEVELSHVELQLRAVALRSSPGDEAQLALPTKDHDIFCYLVDGDLEVVIEDRAPITLRSGDALDVRSASAIFWSTRRGALAVWASCPMRL
jgi:transcriptional regulator with XRE-family HTH domain